MRTLIFTDLDGTLLDHRTYALDPALPVLRELRARDIPVVFCSSKTRAEMEEVRIRAGNADPFIVENGGAAFSPAGYFDPPPPQAARHGPYDRILLGTDYDRLVTALRRVRAGLGVRIRSFADMAAYEIAEATGLPPDLACLARRREFDEPFLIEEDDPGAPARVAAAIEAAGLHCTRGGRYFHITGDNDKGLAVRLLIDLYRRREGEVRVIALGDSPNDQPMLEAAHVAVLVAKPDGMHDSDVIRALPRVHETGPGPEGWAAAVERLIG